MTDDLRRHLSWYSGGTLFTVGTSVGIFLLYARLLPSEQLGALVVTQATVTILRIFGTAGVPLGMFRYLAGPPEDRGDRPAQALVTTTLVYSLLASALLGAVALLIAWPLLSNLPGHDPQQLMALAALTATASAPREIVELVLRAQARSTSWSLYTSASSALLVACAGVAVWQVGANAEAILAFQLGGLILVAAAGAVLIRSTLAPRLIALADLRRLLRLGVAYDANVLLDWVTRYVDRFILLAFVSASEVGVYSFGSRIGTLVQQVGGAAATAAWEPYSLRHHRQPGSATMLGRSSTLVLIGVLALAVVVGAAAQPLVGAVGGRVDYLAGAAFAFPVGLACWLGTARNILLQPLAIRFRPEVTLIALGAAAASTLILDVALIPQYGIWGAAIAFLVSSAIGALVGLVLGQRPGVISYEPKKLAAAFAFATLAYVVSSAVSTPSALLDLVVRPALALLLFVGPLLGLRIVPSPLALIRRRPAPA